MKWQSESFEQIAARGFKNKTTVVIACWVSFFIGVLVGGIISKLVGL